MSPRRLTSTAASLSQSGSNPVRAAHVLSDLANLRCRKEQLIDVTGEPVGVVSQRHRSIADDEELGGDAGGGEPVGQLLEQGEHTSLVELLALTHAHASDRAVIKMPR